MAAIVVRRLRRSAKPGDFLVECGEGHFTYFLDWERVVLCAVSGEAEHICPTCGDNRPTIVTPS